jgi:S-(hydroxymethyl)glutathione dehydrogenase/alcohol dehydrogenase
MPDGTSRLSCRGTPLAHFMGCSTFAEYAVLAAISVAVVPRAARLDRVCLLGCGVSTGFGAVLNTARVEAGATAAVFGLGAVGLAACVGLRAAGARRIIAVDVDAAKEAPARALGGPAVEFLNAAALPAGATAAATIVEMTTEGGAGGVDYSFECVGSTALMRAALECTHKGWGTSVIIGVAAAGQEISTRPFQLVTGRTWKGTAFGGYRGRTDVPKLCEQYASGALPLDAFVTHEFAGIEALAHAAAEGVAASEAPAIACMHKGALRPVVTY